MATLTSQPVLITKTDVNNERQNIFELQKFLKKISETSPEIPFLNTDGIYGKETQNAVRKFQETRNLTPTGIADSETWDKIFSEYEDLMAITEIALPFHVFPIELLEIKLGDKGDVVIVIQLLLNSLAAKYSNLKKVNVTGQYGKETQDAVYAFQNLTQLTPTGIVNRPTWHEMVNLYRAFLINE